MGKYAAADVDSMFIKKSCTSQSEHYMPPLQYLIRKPYNNLHICNVMYWKMYRSEKIIMICYDIQIKTKKAYFLILHWVMLFGKWAGQSPHHFLKTSLSWWQKVNNSKSLLHSKFLSLKEKDFIHSLQKWKMTSWSSYNRSVFTLIVPNMDHLAPSGSVERSQTELFKNSN